MTTIERPNESIMGQYVRAHVPHTTLHSLVHSFQPKQPAFLPTAVLQQLKQFPDLSFWQGEVDWDKMASKTDTVILRAGQNLWVDKQFNRNYRESKQRHMRRGVYFFYDDRVDPGKQAALLISLLRTDLPEMRIYVDWETRFGGAFMGIQNVVAFMQVVEKALGVQLGMYTGYWWFRENTNPITHKNQYAYLKERELWEAFYAPMSNVLVPQPWQTLTHWQKGTPIVGLEYGAQSKELDMNCANMSLTEFEARYPIQHTPIDPPIEREPIPEATVWTAIVLDYKRVRVRSYPDVSDDNLTPEIVTGKESFKGKLWSGNNYVWMKIEQSIRPALLNKWVAIRSTDGLQRFISLHHPLPLDLPEPGIPLPSGKIYFVLHDQQAADGRQRVGFPEVYPLVKAQYCPLTSEWQWFWFRQLVYSFTHFAHWDETKLSPADLKMLKGKWASLTKTKEAFTNFKGTDLYTDYINKNGLSGTPGQEPLTCCGNIVKVTGEEQRIAGVQVLPIETLDGNHPPPPIEQINRLSAPHLIHCATNVAATKVGQKKSLIVLADGRYKVDPFPQLDPLDTFFPLRTNGRETKTYQREGVWYATNYITAKRLKEVHGLIVPNPYCQ